mmetsp:Transcript_8890/g.16404  ORF Transcript_8890/g.16404 Transcript_8890/m.16404 type:complete len:260 (-) Transcript_8890:457-1236(-)
MREGLEVVKDFSLEQDLVDVAVAVVLHDGTHLLGRSMMMMVRHRGRCWCSGGRRRGRRGAEDGPRQQLGLALGLGLGRRGLVSSLCNFHCLLGCGGGDVGRRLCSGQARPRIDRGDHGRRDGLLGDLRRRRGGGRRRHRRRGRRLQLLRLRLQRLLHWRRLLHLWLLLHGRRRQRGSILRRSHWGGRRLERLLLLQWLLLLLQRLLLLLLQRRRWRLAGLTRLRRRRHLVRLRSRRTEHGTRGGRDGRRHSRRRRRRTR